MAREGLRTLVVAKKCLSEEQYQDFEVGADRPLDTTDTIGSIWEPLKLRPLLLPGAEPLQPGKAECP